jgi:methylated-DNA-protein-cysteine methyltransferase-like protein
MNEKSFFKNVYEVVCKIPKGRVTTYGAIAEYLGTKKSARMVGWALNKSRSDLQNIPAHRVVNRNGILTGKIHFGGINIMKELLENEGVKIKDDKVVEFDKIFWNPGN